MLIVQEFSGHRFCWVPNLSIQQDIRDGHLAKVGSHDNHVAFQLWVHNVLLQKISERFPTVTDEFDMDPTINSRWPPPNARCQGQLCSHSMMCGLRSSRHNDSQLFPHSR